MKLTTKSGAVLAATAAAMLMSGAVTVPTALAGEAAIGKCIAANACKGLGSCASAKNACKGQAACKGQGFVELTEEQCKQVLGASYQWEAKG
jgi:hypothetical protein